MFDRLRARAATWSPAVSRTDCRVTNYVIGNNAVAVDAAGLEAERRGYSHAMVAARQLEGEADSVGRHLAGMARHMRQSSGPDCLISGGEPTVTSGRRIRTRAGRPESATGARRAVRTRRVCRRRASRHHSRAC